MAETRTIQFPEPKDTTVSGAKGHPDPKWDFDVTEFRDIIESAISKVQKNYNQVFLKRIGIKNLRNPKYVLEEELIIHLEEENNHVK